MVLTNLLGGPGARPVSCRCEPLSGSTGAATGDVSRVTGVARLGTAELPFRLVRKAFRPLLVGRHAPFAGDPRHGAYWRREPLAYASDLLPTGPGLAAPRCYGVVDDVVHLVDVSGRAEAPDGRRAPGRGLAGDCEGPGGRPAGHRLARRIVASDPDWSRGDADPRMAALWQRRGELLDGLARVPRVLVHGDFSAGNLIAAEAAHLALSSGGRGRRDTASQRGTGNCATGPHRPAAWAPPFPRSTWQAP